MTIEQQIIQCARDNGYKGDSTLPHKKENRYSEVEWRIYFMDKDDDGEPCPFVWTVTNKKFIKWQRNKKLKELGI